MDPKQAVVELRNVAQEALSLPDGEALSARLYGAAISIAGAERAKTAITDEAVWEEEKRATAYLNQELDQFPKGHGWWSPPHNAGLNQALMGMNLWQFTILPMFPKRRAYREDHKGIVIHPNWSPAGNDRLGQVDLSGFSHIDIEIAERIVSAFKKMPTIQETVRRELAWIERTFGIKIPSNIQGGLVKDSLKTAKRRWSVDRLRVKDRLVPLDGSKARDLGSFD